MTMLFGLIKKPMDSCDRRLPKKPKLTLPFIVKSLFSFFIENINCGGGGGYSEQL